MQEKLRPRMKMIDFNFVTPWKNKQNFYQEIDGKMCCLFFLRYLGCSTCQLEIHNLIHDYPKFMAKGVKVFVVLQSDPQTLRDETKESDIPFDIICDPEQSLYKMCDIGSNPNPDVHSEKLTQKIKEARALGISHGKFEGNEAQSPATFIIDKDKKVIFSFYGVESVDVPDHEELLNLL